MTDKPPLTNIETISTLEKAIEILGDCYRITEDPYELDTVVVNVRAAILVDIIEMLLLFVEEYEDVDIEKMIDMEVAENLSLIKFNTKTPN